MRPTYPSVPAAPNPEPTANRAARRGRSGKQLPGSADRHHGAVVHGRPAQGRRINPIRRTG